MLANKLKTWRKKKGLSVYAVAKKLGVSPSAISNWETGIRHPHKKYWKKLIELTDGELTFEDFLEDTKTPVGAR